MSHGMANLALTLILLWSAWSDWRTRHVPYPLMWGLLGVGIGMALWRKDFWIAGAVSIAATTSSLPIIPSHARRLLASLMLFSSPLTPDKSQALVILLIGLFWQAYEAGAVGGADAVIALSLLALFPTLAFILILFTSWSLVSGLGWLARRLAPSSAFAKTVPLVVALALAGLIQLWAPSLFAVYQGLSMAL